MRLIRTIKKMIRSVIHLYITFRTNVVLIHIGKCGGSTVQYELKKHKIYYIEKHVCKVDYNPSHKYIILVRNPIQRFISAFNWRYHLLKNKIQTNHEELRGLDKYKTVNYLAENLYSNGVLNSEIDDFINKSYSYGHPSHLGMGINYYIGNFVRNCSKENILGVIATESMKEDMKTLFNIEISSHKKNNSKKYETKLSDLAYLNLKTYLQKDYECINKLFEMELISEKQYATLCI